VEKIMPEHVRAENLHRETTSIKVDPELWKEAKIQAIRDDIELSELVEKAILEYLEKYEHEPKSKHK
jgi:predicted HicB family RNase H-like nuclease